MKDKKIVFADFARKAKETLEAKKKLITKALYIGSIDETITIRALSDQEFTEVYDYSDDSLKNDKYMIYMACDDLRELAVILKEEGAIKEHLDVIDIFSRADRKEIAEQILKISGIYDETTVKPYEELEAAKNS